MNHHKLYWLFTGLMAAFMLMASIPDILRVQQAADVFRHLGYPTYLLPFLGAAKALGVIAVLVPSLRRLKEWAYAGLVFDLMGALYSHLSVGDPPGFLAWPLVGLVMVAVSYRFYRMERNHQGVIPDTILVPSRDPMHSAR
jgi:hypothetical protein